MSTLRTLRQAAAKGPARTPNTFAAVLQVKTAMEEGGELKLTGTILNEVPDRGSNMDAAVVFRGEDASKAVTNFIKGAGGSRRVLDTPDAASGSFVTLESCYLTEDKEGELPVVSSRWLNTLMAANKSEHANRSFLENIFASSPRVSFDNPDYREGAEEPETITIPVAQPKFFARVTTDHGTFNREFDRSWGIEKLKRLPKGSKPSVFIDTIEPNGGQLVGSIDELKAVLTEQLGRGTRATALLRVTDGEEVVDRMVYGSYKKDGDEYKPDPERTIEDLLSNNIFRGLANDDLVAGLGAGTLKIESIPGYRMNYAGNPTQDDNAAFKLVQDLAADRLTRYEIIFGKSNNHFTSVLLPGIARDETIAGFSPINVIADRPGHFAANEIVTHNIDPRAMNAAPEDPSDTPAP